MTVFSRFFTRSPLDDPREKAWTELRMQWLSEQFGLEALRNGRVLLPTAEHFPGEYRGTPEDVERMLPILCRQLHVDPQQVELAFGPDDPQLPAASDGDKAVIRLDPAHLLHQEPIAATLTRELAHYKLLGEGRISANAGDREELADLLPVYFGAGIFAANCTVPDGSSTAGVKSQRRFLPARMFGYAFALFAWVRGEERPGWGDALRKDSREVLQTALRYLHKTGDSLFRPETAGRGTNPSTVADLIGDLQTGTPGRQIGALWGLRDRGEAAADALPDAVALTRSRTPMIAATALEALAAIGRPDADAEAEIRPLLQHSHPSVRSMAIAAALRLAPRREEAAQDFAAMLNDSNPTVLCWAAYALGECGPAAATAESELLAVLKRAIVKHHARLAELCLQALCQLGIDADSLRSAYPDPEVHGQAIDYFRELRERSQSPQPPDPYILATRSG